MYICVIRTDRRLKITFVSRRLVWARGPSRAAVMSTDRQQWGVSTYVLVQLSVGLRSYKSLAEKKNWYTTVRSEKISKMKRTWETRRMSNRKNNELFQKNVVWMTRFRFIRVSRQRRIRNGTEWKVRQRHDCILFGTRVKFYSNRQIIISINELLDNVIIFHVKCNFHIFFECHSLTNVDNHVSSLIFINGCPE